MKAQQKKLSGCASNLLAHEDLGHFEEAHCWNTQAKFYNKNSHLYMKVTTLTKLSLDTSPMYQSLHHHRHHAVMLTKLSLYTLLDQEFEGRHRGERVQNSEVSYICT